MGKAYNWHDEWLIEHIEDYSSYKTMREAYNELFGEDVGLAAIKNHCHYKLGLEKKRRRGRRYTEEQIEWLKEHYPKHGCRKTMEMFNKRFGEDRTYYAIKNFGKTHGITVDEDVATKNKISFAHAPTSKRALKPIGSTRLECGRLVMKTEHGWEGAARVIYRKEHGSIPEGHCVIALDQDCNNIDPDNLVAVPWKYHGLLHKYGLASTDGELTRVGVEWCKLYELIKDEVVLDL